jgi:hypothetical protein
MNERPRCVVRRATVVFTVLAVPAAAASLALGACGGATEATAAGPAAGSSAVPASGRTLFDPSSVVAGALDELVDDGTISASQRDAVVGAFGDGVGGGPPQASPPAGRPSPSTGLPAPQRIDMLAGVLDPLVEDGTLTSAQADAISQALADALPDLPDARAPPSEAPQI